MGAHAEWAENLLTEIDSMHQSRTHYLADLRTETKDMMNRIHSENLDRAESVKDLLAQFEKENELRKVTVSELLSDARDLVKEFGQENQERAKDVKQLLNQFHEGHGEMAEELHESLSEFGADVREAAEIWQNRTAHSRGERSRLDEPEERQAKGEKKKGKRR